MEHEHGKEHEHEEMLQLDGTIRCRTCGEILHTLVESIAIVNSHKRASRILEEIAVAGRYTANHFGKDFVVYARDRNSNREEVTAEKIADRTFKVYRRILALGE